ncbi:MAG: hypothetical protein AAGA16_09860 [Cyanobacteria bacterium P01_E01_bin.35]
MNLDYEVTLQDDLDAMQTYQEWSLNQPGVKLIFHGGILFILLFGSGLLLWGVTNRIDPDAIVLIVSGSLCLASGIFLLLIRQPQIVQLLNRWTNQRQWRKYYAQGDRRQIRLTETEFMFNTSDSELAWSWQTLKFCHEGSQGFMLAFFSGHNRYISKRVFSDRSEIEQFKNLVQEYQKQTKINDSEN